MRAENHIYAQVDCNFHLFHTHILFLSLSLSRARARSFFSLSFLFFFTHTHTQTYTFCSYHSFIFSHSFFFLTNLIECISAHWCQLKPINLHKLDKDMNTRALINNMVNVYSIFNFDSASIYIYKSLMLLKM